MNAIHHLRKLITKAELQAEAARTDDVRRAFLRVKWDCEMQLFFEEMAVRGPRILRNQKTVFHRPKLNTVACVSGEPGTCHREARWLLRLDVMPPLDYPFQKMWHHVTSVAVCETHRLMIEQHGLSAEVLQVHKAIFESGCRHLERPYPDWKTLKLTFLALEDVPGMEWVGNAGQVVLANNICPDTGGVRCGK